MYAITDQRAQEIKKSYTYHAPMADQIGRYQDLRELASQLAFRIEHLCPPSRERSLAQTKLEEVIMWANKAIACND